MLPKVQLFATERTEMQMTTLKTEGKPGMLASSIARTNGAFSVVLLVALRSLSMVIRARQHSHTGMSRSRDLSYCYPMAQ